ncbi:MAG: FG-GAP repeat protein, partial [Planctomycetes bacterium]|nr:FG-GAP repeat protein [Planctomycetota bacterium]
MGTFGTRSKNSRLVFTAAGMLSISLLVGDSLAQTPPLCQQVKYLLSNGNAHDVAGTTVDLNSDFMFVGRPTTNPMFTDPISSVYIFKSGQTPGSWIEYQVILDPREDNTESLFGQRLSVDEDSLIVTMVREESPSGVIGAAAIFRLDVATDTWILEQKLFPFNGSPSRSDVAIDGDFAIIGQRHNNHGGVRAGAAFVFRFDGSSWNEEAEFFTIDRALDDLFGSSVAMFGNIVIVGAPQEDDLGVDSGSVHVYKRINGSWFDVGKINAPDGAAGDLFGGSVDYDGTTLAIGASGHESGGPNSGAVYLYRDNGLPGLEFITKL